MYNFLTSFCKGMGSQQSQQKTVSKVSKSSTDYDQYKSFYDSFSKQNPLDLETHMHECPTLAKNLCKLFPNYSQSFEDFAEMVMYLRKYEPRIVKNKQASENSKNTTLFDRFIMLCLGNISTSEFSAKLLMIDQIEVLLVDYYSLLIDKPDSKAIKVDKILKFMHADGRIQKQGHMKAKDFSEKFREVFPHVQKYLKDYYYKKLHDGCKSFRVLQHFNSKIVKEDSVTFALVHSQISKPDVSQLYNSDDFGIGFHSIEKKLLGYPAPFLLLIEHSEKNSEGQRENYVFGSYQNGPIKDVNDFQGDLTGFMFTLDPNIRLMTTDKGEGGRGYYWINNSDEKITKKRRGIGFGGSEDKERFKLWLDEDLDKSKVFNGNDKTYGYGALAGLGTEVLYIKRMEIWGLGAKQHLLLQQEYWKERYEEIMRRRKVNKKDFFDGNAAMFMENTFAHREQVVGQIETRQKRQDSEEKDENY